jgi:NAD(P)-dependent dehydrogenase (short-subunit alcohol dehydrogenase family)
VDSFAGKLAVVTGGGSGMGRELVIQLAAQGCSVAACDWHADAADDLRQMLAQANTDFRDKAPLSAVQAVAIILDGVRSRAWRILVGEDAKMIDAAVRATPEGAYDYAELFSGLAEEPAEKPPER